MPRFLGVLVASSGAASLVYELIFIRALGRHFGTTTPAITTVVATFMAGMGLGQVGFGRLADRSQHPFALYRSLELGIAATGLACALFLLRADPWVDGLVRMCAAAGPLAGPLRTCVFALCMVLPTTAMGGTLPVLTRAVATQVPAGRGLGLLYAYNTCGAIAGALLPDFVLIPRVGLTWTAVVAALTNVIIAVCMQPYAAGAGRADGGDGAGAVVSAGAGSTGGGARVRRGALLLSAATGFCALGLEVLWSRTLQHWATALVTSFAVLLAVYLAALFVGTRLAQRLADRSRQPLIGAALCAGLAAVSTLLPLVAAPEWRDFERALWPRPEDVRRVGLMREAIDALWHAGYLEALVCVLLGATFPFVAAAFVTNDEPGSRSGQLFLVNTVGSVLGVVVIGFAGLPLLGEQGCYQALALLLAAAAAVAAWLTRPTTTEALEPPSAADLGPRAAGPALRRSLTWACVVCVVALVAWLPARQLSRAHFRAGGKLIAMREGPTTTALVAEHYLYGEPYYRELVTPGVSMSSTRLDARRYMALMAHAALLAAPQAERALLVCYGVGNTARALLSKPALHTLDIAELSSEVLALSPHFAAVSGEDPLADPRARVFVDDGRHHLITHDHRYDVITAEPPPPNHAGVVNLYDREFYRLAKQRLTAAGVITQWLPVFQLSDTDVAAMIAAFVAELPHSALLYGYREQLILIGSQAPLRFDPLAAEPEQLANMRANGIGGVEDILGAVLQNDAELRSSVAGVTALTNEHPSIEYPFELVPAQPLYTARLRQAARDQGADSAERERVPLAADPHERERTAADALQRRVMDAAFSVRLALAALPLLERERSEAQELALGRLLEPALVLRPDDEALRALLSADADRVRLAERALSRPAAAELLAQPAAAVPPRARARHGVLQDAAWLLARHAFYARDYTASLQRLQQLTPEPQDRARHALFVAGCLRALGRSRESAASFTDAAALSSDAAFQQESRTLAERAASPFARSAGPWSAEP